MPRDNIVLQCGDCKSRNYTTTKNKKTTTERLEFKKFCRRRRERGLSSPRAGLVGRLSQFIRDVRAELKRVSWPTAKEVKNTTIITLIAVIFFAAYLFAVDQALARLITGLTWVANKILGVA